MTSQEFVQSWNDAFPRAKVSQNEISNPTEAFLIKCLVNLFRSISIDVDFADFDPGSTDQDTLKKNKLHLFQYVNDMYRSLHNKKFLYFDLIHPSKCPIQQFALRHFPLTAYNYFSSEEDSEPAQQFTKLRALLSYGGG